MPRYRVPLKGVPQKPVGVTSQNLAWADEDPDGSKGIDIDGFVASPWIGLHYRHEFLLHHRHELLEQQGGQHPVIPRK